jgi:16S rRNA (guanine966-N2)-methyltransferase
MRVIAGRYKGRRLNTPTWEGLRPTSDKLRETLFNILAPRVEGARVFDGFAGTGALGIEALSRGASHVTFADRDPRAVALIRTNLAACGIRADYNVQQGDVLAALGQPDVAFDLILLDPPYDLHPVSPTLEAAAARLTADGLLVLERATRREPDVPATLTRVRDVKSGDSTLTVLKIRNG